MKNHSTLERMATLLLLVPGIAYGQGMNTNPIYHVRSVVGKRDLQTQLNPLDMLLSFSDDGADKEDEFYLDLFDTPALLTNSDTPLVISNAMNTFLLAELNGRFDDLNSVEKVSSEIFSLSERNGTYVNSSGLEDTRIGTETRMKVTLSFELLPSPKTDEVIDLLKDIMSNLTYFVTNLTSSVSDDNELSGVYEAIRREIRKPVFVTPTDQTIVVDISGQNKNGRIGNTTKKYVLSAVPIVLVVAVLAAVIVFFVFKKKRKTVESESVKDSELMHMDVENDVYSIDRSVGSAESPKSVISKLSSTKQDESSIQHSMSNGSGLIPGILNTPGTPDTPGTPGTSRTPGTSDTPGTPGTPGALCGDSVFSGIDTTFTGVTSSVLSPSSISSPKSMMTGFTCASGSTVRASNIPKKHKNTTNPKSPAGGSVFAFLDPIADNDDEDDHDDELELMERAQPAIKSSEGQNNSSPVNSKNTTDKSESSSSLEGVSISLPAKPNKENEMEEDTASTEPVSHVLADLENMEATMTSTPRDSTPSKALHAAEANNAQDLTPSKNGESTSPSESEETNLEDGHLKQTLLVDTGASNKLSRFSSTQRKNKSTPNSPVLARTKTGTRSAPGSPVNQAGRPHWLKAFSKKTSRIPRSPKFENNDDYEMDLSNPSPTKEDYVEGRELHNLVNKNMKIVDRPPQDSEDFDHSGRRRHVGDNVVDGSALYQASAMHPTDWSYKSSDADSDGASTIDEEGSQNRQKLLSKDGTSTNKALMDGKKSTSASRQLIDDLVWLEKKIATVKKETATSGSRGGIETDDSLSFDSKDKYDEADTSHEDSDSDVSNIVCRDLVAPPGKLHIVIHSTKDGPEVHTVRDESSLQGEIFPGDLIIAVDDIDTRTSTAEEVMTMMASRGDRERKITILRFKEDV